MNFLQLASPSLVLPQTKLRVRRDFNVKALINVGSGYLDLVSGRPCTLTGAVQRTVGPSGRRFHAAVSSVYAESQTGLANGAPVTLIAVSTSTSGSSVAAISDARASWSSPKVDSTSGVLTAACKVFGGTQLSITGPTVTVGKTYAAALHWRPGVGLRASFNGGAVQSSSHSATSLYVTPATLWMGGGTGSNVYLVAALAGELSDDDLRVLSANPWSLLDAEDSLLWWPSTAGGSVSASGGAVADGSATAQAQVALAAVGVAVAGGSAGMQAEVPLSAAGFSVSSGSAGLQTTVSISAAGLAEAAGQAGLAADVLLAGAGAAQASGNATLAAQLALLASGAAQAGGSATLSGGSPGEISASGGAASTGSAVLNVSVQLAASAGAQAGGAGNLTATVTLTAAGFIQAMGAGALFVSIDLAAIGSSTAGGLAALAVDDGAFPARDDRYVVARAPRDYTVARAQRSYRVNTR